MIRPFNVGPPDDMPGGYSAGISDADRARLDRALDVPRIWSDAIGCYVIASPPPRRGVTRG
jgi:hypothetical protein